MNSNTDRIKELTSTKDRLEAMVKSADAQTKENMELEIKNLESLIRYEKIKYLLGRLE